MRNRVAFGLLLGVGLASSVRAGLAGAWTLGAGTGPLIITNTLSQGVDIFNVSRSLQSTPRYTKDELQALVEYGVTDRFTVILEPMLQNVDIGAPIEAQRSGLGYTEL